MTNEPEERIYAVVVPVDARVKRVPFQTGRPGAWAASVVSIPGGDGRIERVTAVFDRRPVARAPPWPAQVPSEQGRTPLTRPESHWHDWLEEVDVR